MILGIDEVGRGPWAGPLVVGAVVLPDVHTLEGLTDSKKLTAKKRVLLDALIREQALGFGLGWVHADELDEVGLRAALRLATIRAVEAVNAPYHEIIIDGTINFLKETSKGIFVTTMPKADLLIPAVSAASIIAKVARDTYMEAQSERYPEYGFASHVGYGTAKHSQALITHGVTPLHRKSFAPIKKLLGETGDQKSTNPHSTKAVGDVSESHVANYLIQQGYTIIERNWRTKYGEIDIVAEKDQARFFVEVKYRSSEQQGGGFEAITIDKLRRMRRAAEAYLTKYPIDKAATLLAAAVAKDGTIELLSVE